MKKILWKCSGVENFCPTKILGRNDNKIQALKDQQKFWCPISPLGCWVIVDARQLCFCWCTGRIKNFYVVRFSWCKMRVVVNFLDMLLTDMLLIFALCIDRSNTNHDHDQPVHLRLKDPTIPEQVNWPEYAGPESRYCPARVYEWAFLCSFLCPLSYFWACDRFPYIWLLLIALPLVWATGTFLMTVARWSYKLMPRTVSIARW